MSSIKKLLQYYVNLPYEIKLTKLDDGDYFAQYSDMNLASKVLMCGSGSTASEAIEDLKEAFRCYLKDALAKNEQIPTPAQKDTTKSLNLKINATLVDEIDYYAKKLGLSRAAFLSVSAKKYIKELRS